MLNMTKVDIELISDTDKYFFFLKKGMMGGGGGGASFSQLQEISKARIKSYYILKCG